MQAPPGPATNPEWASRPAPPPDDSNSWLEHARQFSYVRAHLSAFALGSVLLLSLNLLVRSPDIWADTWIMAWGMIVIMHVVVAIIATLTIQLMAEDDIRPASEVDWRPVNPVSTWKAPKADQPASSPETPADIWQAAATDRGTDRTAAGEDRVSWQAAADAAWLNRPADAPDDANSETDKDEKPGSTA